MQRLGACGFDGERRGGPGDIGQRGRLGGNDGLAQTGADRSQQQERYSPERCRVISSRFVCVWNVHDDSFRRLLLFLLSRESFIFQIADVDLLHSATRWRLSGQKYLLSAEV